MHPTEQTLFGSPHGNCFQACVASVLELPLATVPHFCDGGNERWYMDLEEWLKRFYLAPIMVRTEGCPSLDGVFSIAGGPGPRGVKHSVVYFGGNMAFDPHPSGEGLLEVEDFIFFVQQDPARVTWRFGVRDDLEMRYSEDRLAPYSKARAMLQEYLPVFADRPRPALNIGEDGELELEWQCSGDRSLTMYFESETERVTYLRAWGVRPDNEMSDGTVHGPEDARTHLDWLAG